MRFFATAAKGTEPALEAELREIGLGRVRQARGGVHFDGKPEDGFRACLHSRIAVRVLQELATFAAPDEQALYDGVRAVDLSAHFGTHQTLAVRATVRSSRLTHAGYVAQKTKDAIVDRLRDLRGTRPSVDVDDPDVLFSVHLARNRASLHLDLSGEPLHRRGWREGGSEAPIKETLAAAIVRLSGWDRARPFVDPMCGSGTIAIEAALAAAGVAPGILRSRFGFERWASHDETARQAMADLREEARAMAKEAATEIVARDIDPDAVARTEANARRAGARVRVERARIASLETTPGFVVMNPPYGERMPGGADLYEEIAGAIVPLRGRKVCILSGSRAIERAIPIRARKRIELWNGKIECRLLCY